MDGSLPCFSMGPSKLSSRRSWKTYLLRSSRNLSTTDGTTIGMSKRKIIARILCSHPSEIRSKVSSHTCRKLYHWHHFWFFCLSIHHHDSCFHLFFSQVFGPRSAVGLDSFLSFHDPFDSIRPIFLLISCDLLP